MSDNDTPETTKADPTESTEHAETSHNGKSLNGDTPEQILSAIRGNEFLSGIVDGRDVSLVYIDRHRVQNYFGAEPSAAMPVRRPAEAAVRAPRRIGELVINPLPGWELERTAAVYLSPRLYDAALQRLREHGLLILCGRPGTGKRATAIRLLGQLIPSDGVIAIYELNPGMRLTDLRPNDLPEDTPLLLETTSGSALEGFTRFQLDALYNALNPQGRRNGLVIVAERVPESIRRSHGYLIQEWTLQWADDIVTARRNILVRHLRYLTAYEPDVADVMQPQINQLDTIEPLNDLLSESLTPGQLAELAELLLPVLRGQMDIRQALAHFGQRAYQDVEAWFADAHPTDLENLLIATAVFNGAPYTDVSGAAEALEAYLGPDAAEASDEEKPAKPASRFADRDRRPSARLAAIRARPRATSRHTHYGEVLDDAIELENAAWQEAVLRFVREDPEFGGRVLQWLMSYGSHSSHHLRTRAAAAIGALARHNFAAIEADVLRAWAASPNANSRRSAAQVLGITIWDEAHSGPSARLLHYWASQRDNPRWQWTTAASYAGLAGPRYPQQTLADLKLIAANSHHHSALLEPIFRALLNFHATAQRLPERRLALLEELVAWSDHQPGDNGDRGSARAIQRTALLAFWVMLWPERNDPVWQLLLSDIGVPGAPQALAVRLMRSGLNFRQPRRSVSDSLHPRRLALDGLRDLIVHVARGRDPDQQAYLEGLLTALVNACRSADPDEVERLRYHAEGWEQAQEDAPQLVSILLAR